MSTATTTKKHINGTAPSGTTKPGLGLPKKKASEKAESTRASVFVAPTAHALATQPTAAASSTDERMRKLPPARRIEMKIGNVLSRWANLMKEVSGWTPQLDEAMKDTHDLLEEARLTISAMPSSFTPPRRTSGAPPGVVLGSIVCVTDKAREHYVGVLEEDEFTNLKVLVIKGSQLRCITQGGISVVLPRGHLCLQKKDAAEEEGEEA